MLIKIVLLTFLFSIEMSYFNIFDAIKISWKDLFDSLETNHTKLYSYIENDDDYYFVDKSEDDLEFKNYNEMMDVMCEEDKEIYNKIHSTENIMNKLMLFREYFMKCNLFDEDILIERRVTITHSTQDEMVCDLEDVEVKNLSNREELEQLAEAMKLRNYEIRNFAKISIP